MNARKDILELFFELHKTQRLLEVVVERSMDVELSPGDISEANHDALEYIKKRFPELEIWATNEFKG